PHHTITHIPEPKGKKEKSLYAFILGLWSADGFINITQGKHNERVYRCGVDIDDPSVVHIFQKIFEILGWPLRFRRENRQGCLRLYFYSKALVELIMRNIPIGQKTLTNPKVPLWIAKNEYYIKHWILGVITGDGRVEQKRGKRIEWKRTIAQECEKEIVLYILSHPKTRFNKLTKGYNLEGRWLGSFQERLKVPKYFKQETRWLRKHKIQVTIDNRVNYYPKTRRMTVTWTISVRSNDAKKLAQMILPDNNDVPWRECTKIRKIMELATQK
ncbi:MAG: hypothetical protein Q6363_007500, partial [Candidatus Njordarchaeota archaeon]